MELSQHDPLWYFPHLWYEWVEDVGDHTVHFIVLDTEAYKSGINNASDMVTWFEETLSQSTADWKIVFGHHPAFSAGDHGPVSQSILEVEQIQLQLH